MSKRFEVIVCKRMLVPLRCKFGTNFLKWDFTRRIRTQAIAEWKEVVLKDSTITKASHDDTFKKKTTFQKEMLETILHELTSNALSTVIAVEDSRVYIVHLGHSDGTKHPDAITDTHNSLLATVLNQPSYEARDHIIYSYKHTIDGFAVRFTTKQAKHMSELPDVVSIHENHVRKLHTTRSWDYMGVSGISGEGYVKKEMPSTLHTATGKKLIGARYHLRGYLEGLSKKENKVPGILSARDDDGHGTHTASTLAGRLVQNASVVGRFAQGTAAGGVPGARLAAYKACWGGDDGYCHESDLIAAMDQAVHDGVDVISMSNGGEEYVNDVVALAALSAVKKGVTVVASAGNEGVKGMGNSDPWFITVGASSMDRWGSARLSLGNGMTFTGKSRLSIGTESFLPLVPGYEANAPESTTQDSLYCMDYSLDREKVQGKIVLCMRKRGKDILAQSSEVRDAGGAGMILYEDVKNEQELMDDWHYVPSIHISAKDALAVFSYMNSSSNPRAYISGSDTNYGAKDAPAMSNFSSRGPSKVYPDIIKPDITAPGVDILAAWPPNVDLDEGRGRGNFNFQSGTSMSCPHVAGVAALLKSYHQDWSPAAIKSAILTTAYIGNGLANGTPNDFGSGHINPNAAAHPGLIYDLDYNKIPVKAFGANKILSNLNFPSVGISRFHTKYTVKRTVTNVGDDRATYRVTIDPPPGIAVTITPQVLEFTRKGQSQSFLVNLRLKTKVAKSKLHRGYIFGSFTWKDERHTVRSPIAVRYA
ncbi:hypothetical protein SELMODRAFT_422004 [Selaginella moellendorffii]|uniref:Peptidase S8/S53 domain-containing protein n=1 Tax=Selaginella moellendorffii TaxID=88036 RepID=D8SH15_SELML|nr:hypothetical protein SELMODRAFT_422004 [Selaginella moellendorffii]